MDDFGSGYSSLNALKDLLFNEVKIDRKFLGDSLTENAKIVLQEVFHMLKRMGKSIVCEGAASDVYKRQAYIISRLFPATMSEMLFQLPYRACFQEIQILSISPAH